jgi:hypothetical protein
MRKLNLMTAAMSATIPMMVNTVTVGSPFGRIGTPLFGIDYGLPENEDGSHKVLDLGQISGLARATREWGVSEVYKGLRAGQTPEQIGSKAALAVARGRSHPWTGPGVSAGIDAIKKGPRKAAENINPMFAAPLGTSKYGFFEEMLTPESGERTAASRAGAVVDVVAKAPTGAVGHKDVFPTRSASEQYVMENRTKIEQRPDAWQAKKKIRDHAEALLREDEDSGFDYLQEQITADKIDVDYAETVVRELNMSKLQRGFISLSAKALDDTALNAYRLAELKEKAQLFRLLENKIANQEGNISAERIDALDAFMDSAYEELVEGLQAGKITLDDIYERE